VIRDSSGESAVQILAPNVLCVDDDPHVLVALRRTLCQHFCVDVAQGGEQGLELLEKKRYAVVIVDMKMPRMPGPEFLRRARELAPETTRVLLTGNSDLESAISAMNDGAIFRFVRKPYNPVEFPSTVADAVHHHHLRVAEKDVAHRTLFGTVDLLVQVASFIAPGIKERLVRVRDVARSVSQASGIPTSLPLETAALVVALACATEPQPIPRRAQTAGLLERSRVLAGRLLGTLPASAEVLELFAHATHESLDSVAAALLRPDIMALLLLLEWVLLIESGSDEAQAQALLEQRGVYPRELLEALGLRVATTEQEWEISVSELEPGLETRSDIVVKNSGQVLLPKGAELTRPLLNRIRHYARSVGVVEPIWVAAPRRLPDHGARNVARNVVGGDVVAESDQLASGTWKTK